MFDMSNNRAILITRVYKKNKEQYVASSQERAYEWIEKSRKTDLPGVDYIVENLWIV